MPGEYDPRRYGPTVSAADVRTKPLSVCAATPRVLVRTEEQKHLLFARTLRRHQHDGRQSALLEQQRLAAGFGSTPMPSARTVVLRRLLSSVHDEASPRESRFRKPGGSRTPSTARSTAARSTPSTTGFAPPEAAPKRFHRQQARHDSPSNRNKPTKNDHSGTPATTPTTFLASTASSANAFVDHGGGSDAASGACPERRGRTRRRSLSWQCRQKAVQPRIKGFAYSSTCSGSSPAAISADVSNLDRSSNSSSGSRRRSGRSSTSKTRARNTRRRSRTIPSQHRQFSSESSISHCVSSSRDSEVAAGEERSAGRDRRWQGRSSGSVGAAGTRRGESIDAEQLFRRKNKMATYNVTYRRWAESYDRSTASRLALKRQERLETEREVDLRRQRADQEFQKWVRSHKPRSASAAAAATLPASASSAGGGGGGGGGGLGPRSSYRERASSASPLRRTLAGERREAWATDGFEKQAGSSSAGASGGTCFKEEEEEEEEEQQQEERFKEAQRRNGEERKKAREVDRAFRAWLDCKKKQAHAEREAQKEREEILARRRKLEASRRWKKRPVVCAYTYGAKVGARKWKDEEETGGDGRENKGQQGNEQEDERTQQQQQQR